MDGKDYKERARAALMKFHEKDLKEVNKLSGLTPKRKNQRPEKAVQDECLEYMKKMEWEVEIYESKAVNINGVWRNPQLKAGHADCAGLMPDGTSVAVEFKAPQKLKTFNAEKNIRQKDFIIKRIHMMGFSCVVDSVERLKEIYETWDRIRKLNPIEAKNYLIKMLP